MVSCIGNAALVKRLETKLLGRSNVHHSEVGDPATRQDRLGCIKDLRQKNKILDSYWGMAACFFLCQPLVAWG